MTISLRHVIARDEAISTLAEPLLFTRQYIISAEDFVFLSPACHCERSAAIANSLGRMVRFMLLIESNHTLNIGPLIRRGLALFFSLMKRTKNQVSRKASLRSGPLRCKADKTWAEACCRRLSHKARASGNIPNSPAAAPGPPLFYLLSSEDLRLTQSANIERVAFIKPDCHPVRQLADQDLR